MLQFLFHSLFWKLFNKLDSECFKPGNINEERQEGEECCGQTHNRDDSNKVSGKDQFLLVEEH